MIFKQVFDPKTSTYTYFIGSAKGREAVIIDPVIENVNKYIQLLTELDLKLVKVIDTHIHADHVTGASKLKKATNCATIMGEHTPSEAVEIKVKDNEIIKIDNLEIKSIYTPGHTSESYSFLLENYLFSGPINTVKQGEPIPLVYGRIVTGSKTVMGSLFTTSSNNESQVSKSRKLVGIGGFRDDGDKHGLNSTTQRYQWGWHSGWGGPGPHGGMPGGEGYS